ncbi:hypothetical protein LUZ62_048613 [Rhynchospora pubera]|uniref:RING-type E3 ubiquitin transferase n=1 Tax=Rhynchospora pubera TaxID=906938 RepID=A0AAV8G2G1_9POAL|nr:hypothetical protein LUZ62_048613 [Rhynchospora pubera]
MASSNSSCDMNIDFEVRIHQNEINIDQAVGNISEKILLSGTSDCNEPFCSLKNSVHVLEELPPSMVVKQHFLEVQQPQHVSNHIGIYSPVRAEESKRLQQELQKLEKLRYELLNENNTLRNIQNNMAKELENLRQQLEEHVLKNNDSDNFLEFSNLELKEATNDFDMKLKIGEGGYGSVYKGVLHCTTVAIKILRPGGTQGEKEFYQEIEILRKVRHPNIVTLIGGCSEMRALVYEYIPNGSLEYYLSAFKGKIPLSWRSRIQIASNICSALIFLHSAKPHGIAHGDLKPANILLDSNFQAKLSDFGISRQLMKTDYTSTAHHLTEHPKGTVAYIDPEYLCTGEMNPQCDVYSFGVVLLQLVTGKSATNIIKSVHEAVHSNVLNKEVDASAKWPYDKAIKMAKLGLYCCNAAKKHRPSLSTEVWSEIESLMVVASS